MKKPFPGDKADMTLYSDLLADIKMRIRQAQNRAVMSANAEMIRMYWDIGHMVAKRQGLEGWGKGLLRRLAVDLRDELPEIKGFSERNLQLMIQFQREYPDLFAIPQRPVAELPKTSLPGKIRPQPWAEFDPNDLAQSAQGSGETQIVQRVVAQLPWAHNVILIQKLKDLPTRFWYARQVHLDVAEEDFYIDLLFYHLRLRSFVVVDLKIGPFKPEYAGKINFYCNVVDDQYRHATDNPTIGLILCQDKKRVLAEYALRGLDKPIGISEYELTRALPEELKFALPTIEEIEAELSAGLQDENEGDDKD